MWHLIASANQKTQIANGSGLETMKNGCTAAARMLCSCTTKLSVPHRNRYLAVVVLAAWVPAQAQFAPSPGGCPPGMFLQGFSCVYNRAPSPAPAQAPAPPAAEWATRWGAIAIGSTATDGGFGASTNMRSKSQAEQAAAEKSKNTGGGDVCRAYAY